jgi:hypothetical protein
LHEAWLDAPDLSAKKRIAAEIQEQALRDVAFIPLGLTYSQSAYLFWSYQGCNRLSTRVLERPAGMKWRVS